MYVYKNKFLPVKTESLESKPRFLQNIGFSAIKKNPVFFKIASKKSCIF
jgi:hypothetical protein